MQTPATAQAGVTGAGAEPRLAAMRRAAGDFEAVFLGQMLSEITASLGAEGPLGSGEDPFGAMLRDEYAKLIGRQGGIGIADAVMRQLVGTQEVR